MHVKTINITTSNKFYKNTFEIKNIKNNFIFIMLTQCLVNYYTHLIFIIYFIFIKY